MMSMSGSLINFDQFHDTEAIKEKALENAATGGANSGFEIEGADFFKNPELTNEFPEMKDDIDLIVSTESFVRQLVDFRQRVVSNRGMSRGMAIELLEMVPSLESHTSPMHFTEEISSINADWSLEAIDVKLWALIAAAVGFVLTLIYKFFNWLTGGDGESSDGPSEEEAKKNLKEAEKNITEQSKAVDKATDTIKATRNQNVTVSIPATVDHAEIQRSHMPKVLKDKIVKNTQNLGSTVAAPKEEEQVEIQFNVYDILSSIEDGKQIYEYIVNPNQYARIIYGKRTHALELVTGSFNAFQTLSPVVLSKIDLLDEMIEDLKKSKDNKEPDIQSSMKFKANLEEISKDPLMGEKYKVGQTYITSLAEWATGLRTEVMNSSNYRGSFTDLEEMMDAVQVGMRRLKDVQWPAMASLFEVIARAKGTLVAAGHEVNRIQKEADHVKQDPDLASRSDAIMKLIRAVQSDIGALMAVYSIISKVYREVSVHGAKVLAAVRHNAKAIVSFYHRFKLIAPGELEIMVDEIEELEQQMKDNQVSPRIAVISLKDLPPPTVTMHVGGNSEGIVLGDKERQMLSDLGVGPKT